MDEGLVLTVTGEAIKQILTVSAPALIAGLVVGLIVSLLMALTQIHEQTLAFVPKIVAVLCALVFFGPWMLTLLVQFTARILLQLPSVVR
ncbi:MAG TPA: flagellar biosynthesis protein FliQ [Firmicutes bacterium]|nr:flagellar biosynthesis protein FliQ [Bacillota bacterium]